MSTELQLLCEICTNREPPIGVFDLEDLVFPITGAMFKSPDPGHEVPPPFDPSADWTSCRCKRCGFRPFPIDGKTVLTNVGYVEIVEPGEDGKRPADRCQLAKECSDEFSPEGVVWVLKHCPICNRDFKTAHALKTHIGKVHK